MYINNFLLIATDLRPVASRSGCGFAKGSLYPDITGLQGITGSGGEQNIALSNTFV